MPVGVVHPNLRGSTKLTFSTIENLTNVDVMFVCLPNGISQTLMPNLMTKAKKVIDLGADFRLTSAESYEQWYGETHAEPKLIEKFTDGIAELNRDNIKQATHVACYGCEATCSILALYPLYKAGVLEPDKTIIEAKIGSSAAGASCGASTHHPERAGVMRSYKPTMHRHTAEIEQIMKVHMPDAFVSLSATAVEVVRGILVTAHVFLAPKHKDTNILKLYKDCYQDEPFVRIIVDKMGLYRVPEPKILSGTNFCDIGFEKDARSNRYVIMAALDNLGKGNAGQAVQAMNIMYGFDETNGLEFTGLHPV